MYLFYSLCTTLHIFEQLYRSSSGVHDLLYLQLCLFRSSSGVHNLLYLQLGKELQIQQIMNS